MASFTSIRRWPRGSTELYSNSLHTILILCGIMPHTHSYTLTYSILASLLVNNTLTSYRSLVMNTLRFVTWNACANGSRERRLHLNNLQQDIFLLQEAHISKTAAYFITVPSYYHVKRLLPEHPTHAVLHFNPKIAGWRRPRGAPHTRWISTISRDLEQQGLSLPGSTQTEKFGETAWHIASNRLRVKDAMMMMARVWLWQRSLIMPLGRHC